MSTPPIQIQISASDQTASAFASATRGAQMFQQGMERTSYNMREATASAKLMNEEIGLKMGRHLTAILSHSQLLGPLLQAAFPLAAAAGFAEVIASAADRWSKWVADVFIYTDAMKQAESAVKSLNSELLKQSDALTKLRGEYNLIGLSGSQKTLAEFNATDAELQKLQARQRQVSDNRYFMRNGLMPMDPKVYSELGDQLQKLDAQIKVLQQRELNLGKEGYVQGIQEQTAAAEKAAAAHKKFADAMFSVFQQTQKLQPTSSVLPDRINTGLEGLDSVFAGFNPATPVYAGSKSAMDLTKIQTDQNAAIQAAQQIYEQTKTKTQEYSDAIAGLTELLNQSRISQEQFATAAMQAGQKLNENNKAWRQFGEEVGRNIEQAALFGRSWSDALKAIMVDVAKLTIQMTILKKLEEKYGEGGSEGGAGGFFTALVGGFSGKHASGGTIPAGMYGLVGENGPELAYGGTSGLAITPNSRLGGTVVYDFSGADFRGAPIDLEQRIVRAIQVSEERAVRRSVFATQERMART